MIALVDCNNFFASCERLFRPDLRQRPVLVLSNNDGCVVARSNEVKALGIPMGVPYFQVRELVEQNSVTCFSSNFALYSNLSQRIVSVLQQYTPQLEVYSIDEAFLQLDELAIADYAAWGDGLRARVQREVGMPVSIGIAPTKTLAKLASEYAKKHQFTCVLEPTNEAYFKQVLESVPVGDIWGIGRRLAPRLIAANVRNAWQLSQISEPWLRKEFGINGSRIWHELRGDAVHPFQEDHAPQKSLLASRSFGHTISNYHELEVAVASFASQAAFRLRKHDLAAGVFGIYLRYRDTERRARGASTATTLHISSNDTAVLVAAALTQLKQVYDSDLGYIKAGVFAHHLTGAAHQQSSLLEPTSSQDKARRKSLMDALDSVNERFGAETLHLGVVDKKARAWHARKERISPAYTTNWDELPLVHPLN